MIKGRDSKTVIDLNSEINSDEEFPFIQRGKWVEKWIPIFHPGLIIEALSKIEKHYEIESYSITRFGKSDAVIVVRTLGKRA